MQKIKEIIENGIPGSNVQVEDLTGTADHFGITVTSAEFSGKRLLQQHKMVMDLLKEELKDKIHAVKITTIVEKGEW